MTRNGKFGPMADPFGEAVAVQCRERHQVLGGRLTFASEHPDLARLVRAAFSVAWTDPDFDPSVRAFYYVRVLEIPTPRWSTRDAVRLGLPIPKGLSVSIQERAWTSPIWYTPAT